MNKLLQQLCVLAILIGLIVPTPLEQVFASDDGIIYAESIEEVIENSVASNEEVYQTVDLENGLVNDVPFEETFATPYEEVEDVVQYINEETESYVVVEEEESSLTILNIFANCRLRVNGYYENMNTFGADTAVYYEGYYLFTYADSSTTANAYNELIHLYGIDKVIIDVPLVFTQETNYLSAQGWGTGYMNLDDGTQEILDNASYSSQVVKVAVIDTGVNTSHEIFKDTTFVDGYNFVDGDYAYQDVSGHGTAVAGIIAESTPSTVQIMPLRTMYVDSAGNSNGSMQDMINAVDYAREKGADVVNISLGVDLSNFEEELKAKIPNFNMDSYFATYDETFMKADNAGMIVVVSSGNGGVDMNAHYFYPSASTHVISVGSINQSGERVDTSNYGTSLDFVAPGSSVKVANYSSNNGYRSTGGTSIASPYVAAAAAILRCMYPTWTRTDVVNSLKGIGEDLGTSGYDVYYGYGVPIFGEYIAGSPKNGFIQEHGNTYYYRDGVKLYKQQKIGNDWYCFDKDTGVMKTGFVNLDVNYHSPSDSDKIAYYDPSSGKMLKGQRFIDGYWYMFDQYTGAMQTGFVNIPSQNKTVYYDTQGRMLKGQRFIDGYWYMFDQVTGAMQTGFVDIPSQNKTVYYDVDGKMLKGQRRIHGYWYMFDQVTGAMQRGFVDIPSQNKTVFYNSQGRMLYGQQYISGHWYYFTEGTGAMKTGFVRISYQNKTVYYNANGQMLYGSQKIDGKWYTFDQVTGAMK